MKVFLFNVQQVFFMENILVQPEIIITGDKTFSFKYLQLQIQDFKLRLLKNIE